MNVSAESQTGGEEDFYDIKPDCSLSPLTKLEVGNVTLHPGTGPGAGCYLHAVADPWGQTGNHHGKGRSVNRAVDVVPALIPQAPDLRQTQSPERDAVMKTLAKPFRPYNWSELPACAALEHHGDCVTSLR